MSDKPQIPTEIIQGKVHLIRKEKVLLDRDLAEMYGVQTKQLKRAVRRNSDRFPEDFMFELSDQEFENLRSQIGTSSWGGTRYAPMAFTEQGVAIFQRIEQQAGGGGKYSNHACVCKNAEMVRKLCGTSRQNRRP
ncbi:MAG: ORF6N domain-containing protein [Gracilimonas sp.]